MPSPTIPPSASSDPDAAASAAESRALTLSIVAGGVAAVLAVVWGIASGSRVILFDGVSAMIGLVLSLASLLAARAAEAGETALFPYGRQSLVPVAIGVQGIARLGFSAYAITDAIIVITDGGDAVPAGSALLYAAIAAALGVGVTLILTRSTGTSELVATEAAGWRVSSILSIAILLGFSVVALLPDGDLQASAAAYVDPVLVIVVSLIVLPVPIRLVRLMLRELLQMTPPADIADPAHQAVREVCARYNLTDPLVRMTKTGGRLYVEVDHVVDPGTWDVADLDRLRRDLKGALDEPAYSTWLNVELSTDPAWRRE